jgi:imidazolonepropionase-like amidohydrolase
MKKILLITLLTMSFISMSIPPVPASNESVDRVFHNATIHLGNGKVLPNATIAFANGKITRVGYFRMAWQETDIDLKGKHVYPGFILPNSDIGLNEVGAVKATIDGTEVGQLNPNIRSIVAYNTDSEKTPTLKFNGIMLAQTTPQGGLVSGLSSIVQLDAWNWEDAAIKIDDGLHLNWPSKMNSKFDFSTFTMKVEKNDKYEAEVEMIKSLFIDAKNSSQKNLKLDAIKPIFKGQRKVYIHSNEAKSIIDSINYFKELGVDNIVLITGQGAEPVIDFIKQSNVPVIVEATHTNPQREDSPIDNGFTMALKLNKAGVLVALGYPGSMSARNLAFVAGTVAAYGVDKEQAIAMITGNTAQILGLDKLYGTLEVDKSATLIITEGDALDMKGNVLHSAFIDGRPIQLEGRQQQLNKRFLDKYNLEN